METSRRDIREGLFLANRLRQYYEHWVKYRHNASGPLAVIELYRRSKVRVWIGDDL